MARLRYNLVEGALAADITAVDTAITLVAALQESGVNIATVTSPDVLAIRIGSEIMWITAYTSGGTSATVSRGQEDTDADLHFAGDAVKHVITKEDFSDSGGGGGFAVLIAASNSSADDQAKADFVCDGSADNVVIQSVIDTYGTGALLTIGVANGTYDIDAQIDVDCAADVVFLGNQGARLFKGDVPVFSKGATGDFSILNFNGTINAYALIGMGIDAATTESISSPTVELADNNSLLVRGGFVYAYTGGTQAAIGGVGTSKLLIEDCDVEADQNAITLSSAGGSSLVARHAYLYGDADYAVETASNIGNSTSFLFDDCWIEGGVRIDGNTGSLPMPDVRIINSKFGWSSAALELLYLSDISNLEIDGGRFSNANTSSCIRLNNVDQGKITTTLDGTIDQHGIWLLDCEDIVIDACNIEGYGRGTDNTYSGIILDGDTNRCQVTNNHIRHGYGSGNMPLNGIRIEDSTCDDNLIKDNYLIGSSKTNGNEIFDAGTGTRGRDFFTVALSDETTAIATTGQKTSMRMQGTFILTSLRASVNTASAASGPLSIDVEEGGVSLLSTALTIDDTELTSVSAATAVVVSDHYVADDAVVTFDLDDAGDGTATGLKVTLYGWYL